MLISFLLDLVSQVFNQTSIYVLLTLQEANFVFRLFCEQFGPISGLEKMLGLIWILTLSLYYFPEIIVEQM